MRHVATIGKGATYLRIYGFNHEFLNRVISPFCRHTLSKWAKKPQPNGGKAKWEVTHVFARSNYDKTEFRIPGSLLPEFLETARRQGFNTSRILILDEPILYGVPVDIKLKPKFEKPRDYQEDWINYKLAEGQLKVNGENTGGGKSYMTLYSLVKLGVRSIITIQPRYTITWLQDMAKTLELEPEDVLTWENSDLELLASNIEKGLLNPKIIILPISRISTWLRDSKKDPDKAELDTLYERMGVGVRVYDEVHESFHEAALSLLYGNFMKTIVLSATLKADDPALNNMYQIVLPKECRLKDPEPEHYIDVIALLYQIDVRRYKPKTMQAGSYNDLVFEQWILDNPAAFQLYFNLAKEMYEDYYLPIREEGTKCLFFFSRVEMCLRMVEAFRKEYPGEDFDSYLGTLDKKTPDKYLKHERLITTPSSCGTGKDIPGLVRCFGFSTIKSQQKGKQMIGRLRDLTRKNEFGGRITPLYAFACCIDIPQHADCYTKRLVDFEPKQKSWKKMTSSYALN